MSDTQHSILIIGESNVGKTHYGAQFLKRLIVGGSGLRMEGAATNLKPFESAMESLAEGVATGHTATAAYTESIWPIVDDRGLAAQLVWPDYGGEQIKNLPDARSIPTPWRDRVLAATDWVLLIRLHTMRSTDDVFSRPISTLAKDSTDVATHAPSDQSRLIELLQMLMYVAGLDRDAPRVTPRITILLTCWDELVVEPSVAPSSVLQVQLPMLTTFIESTWRQPAIWGLSALEKSLSRTSPDQDYAVRGPEQFGYVICPDGTKSDDITLPIRGLLAGDDLVA